MKVLTVSRNFMQGHPRAGQPTHFVKAILEGRKLHTIRDNAKGYFRDGDMASLRWWSGKPYRSGQVEFKQVRLGIQPVRIVYCSNGVRAFVDGKKIWAEDLMAADGLDRSDFINWFFTPGKFEEFRGDILHFTNFRYAGGPA